MKPTTIRFAVDSAGLTPGQHILLNTGIELANYLFERHAIPATCTTLSKIKRGQVIEPLIYLDWSSIQLPTDVTARVIVHYVQQFQRKTICAVDGNSQTGKSHILHMFAERYRGVQLLSTGNIFRAFVVLLPGFLDSEPEQASTSAVISLWNTMNMVVQGVLNNPDAQDALRTDAVSANVALFGKHSTVRQVVELILLSQILSSTEKLIIIDGRHLTYWAMPNAILKFVVTCDRSVIEQRSGTKGLQQANVRDDMDITRPIHPNRVHPDAIVIDNSGEAEDTLQALALCIQKDFPLVEQANTVGSNSIVY